MKFHSVGISKIPYDVKEKALGQAEYVTDMKLQGMLYGRILRSPHAHAKIKKIDCSKAEQLDGVKSVITFKDTPQIAFGTGVGPDDWYMLAKDKVRFIGEEVAAVAAVSEDIANKALSLIEIEYEELPCVIDAEDALKEGAVAVRDETPNNEVFRFEIERGEVDKAFEEADAIFEETITTSQVYHAYLETKAAVAQWDTSGTLTMWLPVQVPSKCRIVYAKALGVSPGKVRVIKPHMGGGFGAKFEYAPHIICAELARKTGKPVKLVNNRKEDFEAGNPRVPMKINVSLAAKNDGTITGKKVKIIARNGARTVYGPPIVATACYRVDALYKFQNVKAEASLAYTNTVPTGCFRGFGNSQMTTALEIMLDRVAEGLNMDPAEVRMVNAVPDNYISAHGWRINTSGLPKCIEKVTEMAEWKDKYGKGNKNGSSSKGLGLACCNHVSGNRPFFKPFDGSSSLIRIGEEGQVTLFHGECDMGQGQDTAFAQIASDAMGIPYEEITVGTVDTQISGFGLGSFATRGTTIGGNGVIAAAKDAKKKILETAAAMLDMDVELLNTHDGYVYEETSGYSKMYNSAAGKVCVEPSGEKLLTIAEVAKKYMFTNGGLPITGSGHYTPDTVLPDATKYGNISPVYPFGAHIAEVDVDMETGRVDVVNYWAAHDVGRVINPQLLEGQLEGGIVQGIGWALMEDMLYDEKGTVRNPGFLDYRIPGPKDVCRINTAFIETDDPEGPFGAKGIGEPALNPVAAAVLNAIYDAIGVRFNALPVTAEQVLEALENKESL